MGNPAAEQMTAPSSKGSSASGELLDSSVMSSRPLVSPGVGYSSVGSSGGTSAHRLAPSAALGLPSKFRVETVVWLSFFALANVLCFHFFAHHIPPISRNFSANPGAIAMVEGGLQGIFALVLVAAWAWFDLPAGWRSLRSGSLTLPILRFLAILAAASGAFSSAWVGLGGQSPGLVSFGLFPLASLVLAGHALLCNWGSLTVARRTGVRYEDRIGLINLVPHGGSTGLTEVHDKMVRLAELQSGDMVRLKPGFTVPCDAIVEQGIAEVEEVKLSGFATLRFKGEGQRVYAGSVVRSGELLVRVESTFGDSVLSNFTEVLDGVIRRNLVPERWETPLHALVLFLGASAVIYFFRAGASGALVGGTVAGVLATSLWLDLLAYLPLLRGVSITRGFERGILCGEPHQLETLGQVRSLVVDHAPGHRADILRVADFTIVDERLDSVQLTCALLSILGRSNDGFGGAAAEFLRGRVTEPVLYEVRDFFDYPGKGISAVVAGAEFSIGDELFLLERGVQIQVSEVEEGIDGELVYVALGEEIAARFTVHRAARLESPQAMDKLHRLGVRPLLMSQAPCEVADLAGKELSLELGQITGGLSLDQYVDRLRNVSPAALACTPETPSEVSRAATVRLMGFDEVRFNLDPKAITVFRPGLTPLVEAYELGQRLVRTLRVGRGGGVCFALATAAFGVITGNPLLGFSLALLAPLYLVGAVAFIRRPL